MSSHNILGVMSGTSMDGVDISFCTYSFSENQSWSHKTHHTKTFPYNSELLQLINQSKELNPNELLILDKAVGKFFAICIRFFLDEFNIDSHAVHAIASHGHTVFHQPDLGYTLQIGCGETIAYNTGINVINDFRQKDVTAGGQGAPLVPVGDSLLFSSQADAFLNIGGFVNICSLHPKIKAFDISPGNLPLNQLVNQIGLSYDKNGDAARKGKLNEGLLHKLNSLPFYEAQPPKSLGTEWLDAEFTPLIPNSLSIEDKLRTIVEHISDQTSKTINELKAKKVLITGGGAKNLFLIEMIRSKTDAEIIIPDEELIDFKEAIVFGFLGALYLEGQPNCLSAVTGSEKDTIGGVLHLS